MKTSRILLLVLPGAALGAPSDNYTNFIRQTQLDTGVEWDVSVASEGQSLSEEGVGPDGSNFELWAVHGPTAQDFLLDEQYVSSFAPNAKITITSGDPYSTVPRTRVDQPFTVTIVVSGLDDGSSGADPASVPDAAKKIGFTRAGMVYPDGTHSGIGNSATLDPISESFIEANGNAVLQFNITALTGPDMTALEGEEVFTANSLASFGSTAAALDSKRIQIWPIAVGSLSGLDTNTKYLDLPPIGVVLHDLYPSSATYVRAYFGAPSTSPSEAVMLQGSYVLVNDSVPQERSMSIDEVDEVFTKDGAYTLEIVHVTPFGTDLLEQFYPLRINRTIEIKASVFSE